MDKAFRRAREFAAEAVAEAQTDRVGLFEVYDDMTDAEADTVEEHLGEIAGRVRRMLLDGDQR